jgi:dihydroflavonol-4-reductase
VSWVSGGLADVAGFARALEGCAALVHCARADHDDPSERSRLNVEGTLALWAAAQRAGVPKFMHLSTISVYELPVDGTVDERAPYTTRDDAYSQGKVAVERALMAQTGGPALGILQPGCVYGGSGGWWTGTLPDLMRRGMLLVPDYGRGIANLIHVEDLAGAVLAALAADRLNGRFIITDGHPITWAAFYDVLEVAVGHTATLRLSTDECLALARRLRRRDWLSRVQRELQRRVTGSRPVFPADDLALVQASSRAVFSPARAADALRFRAARTFGLDQIG